MWAQWEWESKIKEQAIDQGGNNVLANYHCAPVYSSTNILQNDTALHNTANLLRK